MRYRQIANLEVSEIGFDYPSTTRLEPSDVKALVGKALARGINFFRAVEPEEASTVGEALAFLGARKNAVVASGISEFFASHARHHMTLERFLEHELAEQLKRLKSDYVDCFLIDMGAGRAVDLAAVLSEDIPSGDPKGLHTSHEGGVFLHETLSDCLEVIERFKREGRVRLSGISGENVAVLKRALVKNTDFDVAFVPYNYSFRVAADELIAIASEARTAVVATRPLWWSVRGIPVTVLAQSPFPADRAKLPVDEAALVKVACKWPLSDRGVTSVMAEFDSAGPLETISQASTETRWTRADEEVMQAISDRVSKQQAVLVILSAMNHGDPDVRARGWAAYVRRGLPDTGYDPFAGRDERLLALETAAAAIVRDDAVIANDLDELA